MTTNANNANDYAVARELNLTVMGIMLVVLMANMVDLFEDTSVNELNRAYILVVDELQKLYDRNPELAAINPEPLWKQFDVLRTSTWDISDLVGSATQDEMHAHNARVEKLCILAGKEKPDFSPEQQKLVDYAEKITKQYTKMLNKAHAEERVKKESDWAIPEYNLTYDEIRGTIKINDVYQLNKRSTNVSSSIDKILAKGMEQPNELFDPELITSKPLSSVISNAGFTPTLRKLFFPVARKDKGVFLRPKVTRAAADAEGIDTTELDLQLKALGAATKSVNPL